MPNSITSVKDFTIGVSLVVFPDPGKVWGFEREFQRLYGREPLFELAYTMERKFVKAVASLKGRTLSAHAPCPREELFPNLGSRDAEVVRKSLGTIRRSAANAAAFGAGFLILHPGYTTDRGVFVDYRRRLAAIGSDRDQEEQAWLWMRPGAICRPGYCASPGYRTHLEAAVENLREASRICRQEGVSLAVENLNPRLTYLFQLPSELSLLAGQIPGLSLCLDVGHLWISSLVHGFGFTAGLAEILATGRVATAHLHDNSSSLGPQPHLADEHALIGSGKVPLREALRLLGEAGVGNLIIESLAPPAENFAGLLRLLQD